MGSRIGIVKRIVWPARASLFALIGGAVGLFGDLVNFFSEFLSADMLVLIFAVITGVAGLLCFQRAFMVNAADDKAVDDVVQCTQCDAFRFGLFATAAFILLMLVGQGQSATEAVGRQLGLIKEDTAVIRDQVGDLHAMSQPQMIIDRPKSAADHFNNAWIYQMMQRNPAKAFAEMQALYGEYAPRKLDAAQLYFDAGNAVTGRTKLVEDMQALARKTGDATLLVIAARAAPSGEAGDAMAAEAQALDPELPFAWWDIMRPKPMRVPDMNQRGAAAQRDRFIAERALIEKFRALYGAHPAQHWYFLPQYAGDMESIARQQSESMANNIASYDDIASGRLAQRVREEYQQKNR
ncbi:hypothetical protein [Sphingosinicella soli]|uniref:Uncharacterized membrane protein YuzA (DUF378 family) n=1 Tax=Sphingosinicella soli TaxID=333708 RepID=A0A7W7B211_9SPHN|nr:hypothetical protein [Sphingosinicella soli]MBB4632429.1 uncharacterized membrane protein YuzA (DUF378 family) [Sphingosinicella soli]